MPIALAPINEEVTIIRVLADEKNKKHLESLGILVNAKVTVVTVVSSMNGGVIIIVKDGRLALDRSIASKILVA